MKKIILILIFTISLITKGEWSTPVLIAEPESGVANHDCQIAIDRNGVLHTVWSELIMVDSLFFNLGLLKYSQSTDEGKTWSPQVNITPNNTTERIYESRIAIDSENNVHIIFYYISDDNAFYYMNNVGGSWSEPEYLGFHITSIPLIEIDEDDRIYLFFYAGNKSYFIFKEKMGSWNTPSSIPGVENYYIADIQYYGSDLYAVGRELIGKKSTSFARLFRYNRVSESWTDVIDISNSSALSRGRSIYIRDYIIHIAILDGPSGSDNVTVYINGGMDLNSWSVPDTIGINRTFDKQIFVDIDNTPHIFENNSTYSDIIRSYKYTGNEWVSEIVRSDTTSYFDDLNVAFNKVDECYIIYGYNKNIYFQSKIVTGIENSEDIGIINSYQLSNYPNPFNPETVISFRLDKKTNIKLSVMNEKGEEVKIVYEGRLNKGLHQYSFNASGLKSGVYFLNLNTDGEKTINKSLYLK